MTKDRFFSVCKEGNLQMIHKERIEQLSVVVALDRVEVHLLLQLGQVLVCSRSRGGGHRGRFLLLWLR